jgi:nucleotide-binding universal stress UspA family protein
LVFAQPGETGKPALRCAADLADRFEATLIGMAAQPLPASLADGQLAVFQADWLVAMRDEVEADVRAAEQAFKAETVGRRSMWISRRADAAASLAEAARSADLVVVSNGVGEGADSSRSLDLPRLLLTAGRPVLTLAPKIDHLRGRKILVAWTDRRESRRATIDALAFLKAADDVLVLEVATADRLPAARDATAEVAAHLAAHGVSAQSQVVEGSAGEVASRLLEHARWMGADLIVAGAYGHSRIGETLVGGVTHALLHQTEVGVLFSH